MKHLAIIGLAWCVCAGPVSAQTPYDQAISVMMQQGAPDLDEATNLRISQCYVDNMSSGEVAALASAQTPDQIYEAIVVAPMAATACEKAVLSEVLGGEFK